jgi:hypothetical protein
MSKRRYSIILLLLTVLWISGCRNEPVPSLKQVDSENQVKQSTVMDLPSKSSAKIPYTQEVIIDCMSVKVMRMGANPRIESYG